MASAAHYSRRLRAAFWTGETKSFFPAFLEPKALRGISGISRKILNQYAGWN
jgi:hypothetical protein